MTDERAGGRWAMAVVLLALAVGALLRGWDLGHPDLSFDEAFTFDISQRPLGDIPGALRDLDAHPPLDYVVRHPLATGATTAAGMRLPSVVFSLAAVVVTALWLRGRRWLGVAVTVLMAVGPFQVEFGRDARMYAGMVLLGVGGSWIATRWLERPSPRLAAAVAVVVLLALWNHSSGLFLGAGLLAVAGTRTDRDAWVWRASLAGAAVVWTVTWGPAFLEQFNRTRGGWIPYTTPAGVARTINELVDFYPSAAWIGITAVAVGGFFVVRRADPALRRVFVCCFVLPTVLVALVGIRTHVLLPRTLAFASWGPFVALAFLVDAARQRWVVLGATAAAFVALLVVPSIVAGPWRDRQDHEAAVAYAEARARKGDAIATHPWWLGPIVEWRMAVNGFDEPRTVAMPRTLNATALTPGPAWSGRVWLVEPDTYRADTTGFRTCGPPLDLGRYRVRCLSTSAITTSG